jgi:anti-sigma factor RsiW
VPHPADEDLALLALGEPDPRVETHLRDCSSCRDEVAALSATVRTARETDLAILPPPPPAVWDRVAEELGLGPVAAAPPAPPRRRLMLAGAGLTAVAAAAVVVTALTTAGPPERSVELQALGEVAASGRVVLPEGAEGRTLLVDTAGLPAAPDAAYEVWLLDLDAGRLVPLGELDATGRAWVTLPDGVALDDYPLVDVSREPHDGDPGHSGDSVLRAELPA